MQEVGEAKLRQDRNLRGASVASEEWSPKQLPYKVHERDGAASDDSDDSDDSDEEMDRTENQKKVSVSGAPAGDAGGEKPKVKAAASDVLEVDGLSIGMEDPDMGDLEAEEAVKEEGFVYKGPEPTLYGDWQHKGRCSDF